MTDGARETLSAEALPGYEPEIGRLIWMLEANRQRTKAAVEDLAAEAVDWTPAPEANSIGALLYHIAAIELDWLYVDVLQQPFPATMTALFPEDVRDEVDSLARARGMSLAAQLRRLDTVRDLLLGSYREMTLTDYRRPRELPEYDVTPEWVLYHLLQHEAVHRGEISLLRGLREAHRG
jgi:uncharacterized damage-inducible protein DinB